MLISHRVIRKLALSVLIGLTALSAFAQPPPDGPASAELRALAKADQDDRQFTTPPSKAEWKAIEAKDRQRRERALVLLRENKLVTADDFDAAALLFQHGETADDFLAAHELATIARMLGHVGSMAALAEDRFLSTIGKKQRLGSQFHNDKNGRLVFDALDDKPPYNVTDALRRDFFMPTPDEWRKEGMNANKAAFEALVARHEKYTDPAWLEQKANDPIANSLAMGAQTPTAAGVKRVLELYQADKLATPDDYYHAAQVLFLKGEKKSLLAHELALIAAVRGHKAAPKLFAQTLDSYLIAIGRPQRYGTVQRSGKASKPSPTLTEAVRVRLGLMTDD